VTDMQSGDWDFTLFTCTKGGAQRVTVRCSRINNDE
jgi:sortase A